MNVPQCLSANISYTCQKFTHLCTFDIVLRCPFSFSFTHFYYVKYTVWVEKIYTPEVFWIFFQQLRIFNQNFTQLCFHIYGKTQNFIQLSLNLTELCHIKHNQTVNFHFSLMANCTDFISKDEWPPNSPDFNTLDYHCGVQCFRHFTNFTQSSRPFRG